MRMISFVVSYLWASLRETLPSTHEEAGVFLAGFCWAFTLFILCLAWTSWAYCAQRGGC
jgi:hypothetical protein